MPLSVKSVARRLHARAQAGSLIRCRCAPTCAILMLMILSKKTYCFCAGTDAWTNVAARYICRKSCEKEH